MRRDRGHRRYGRKERSEQRGKGHVARGPSRTPPHHELTLRKTAPTQGINRRKFDSAAT